MERLFREPERVRRRRSGQCSGWVLRRFFAGSLVEKGREGHEVAGEGVEEREGEGVAGHQLLLQQGFRLPPRPVLVVGVLLHMQRPEQQKKITTKKW
jgi:hypothetical protein